MTVSISVGFFNFMFKEEEVVIILRNLFQSVRFFDEWVNVNICLNFKDVWSVVGCRVI